MDYKEILPGGYDSLSRKVESEKFITGVGGLINKVDTDYKLNYKDNPEEFTWITNYDYNPDGTPNLFKESFRKLNPAWHSSIKSRGWDKGIPIRTTELNAILGFKKVMISETFPINWLQERYPEVRVKYYIDYANDLLREVATITKIDIVIRTPEVFLANISSNLATLSLFNINPVRASKLMLEGFRQINRYEMLNSEKQKLEIDIRISKNPARVKELKIEIEKTDKLINALPIKEMIDKNMYSVTAEDLDQGTPTGYIEEKIKQIRESNAVLDKVGRIGDWAYMTKGTEVFKFFSDIVSYSDFAARYVLYSELNAKMDPKNPRYSKDTAHKYENVDIDQLIVDSFVYYDLPEGRMLEFANGIGLVMFTRYFLGIQRIIAHTLKYNAVSAAEHVALQALLLDTEDILEQSFLTKNMNYIINNPLGHFETALEPKGLTLLQDILGF